jgi:putative hemolysin
MATRTEVRMPAWIPMPLPAAWLDRLLMLPRLNELYGEACRRADGRPLFEPLLETLGVECACPDEDLARIPATGPVVVVANHPFGLLEGPLLGHLLLRVRPDVRFLGNSALMVVPELREFIFAVDPFGGPGAAQRNLASLRKSLEWLAGGGLLVVFPAGEVSSLRLPRMKVEDPAWNPAAVRLARRSGATVVPVFVHGANGSGFQAAGLLHPRLRTALLGRELLNKRGHTVRVAIGNPMRAARLAELSSEDKATEYLRRRAHTLQWRRASGAAAAPCRPRRSAAVIEAVAPAEMEREVNALPGSQLLTKTSDFCVYIADSGQIPRTLREIGRLREITFREAGEGTGQALDLDRFDSHYEHLFAWNAARREIVGAYRLTETERVLRRSGVNGLYTASLFHIQPELFHQLGPAIELGRSFIRSEYQRSYMPLLSLWKGIGQVVGRRPECRYLFGPVSISGDYSSASREIMVSYLQGKCTEGGLRFHVRPRRAFRSKLADEMRPLAALLGGMDELCEVVADIEPGGRSIPVLLRHYLNVGGRFLGFSVDKSFAGVVDGLVLVDLLRTEPKLLRRHLGEDGARRFTEFHRGRM